MDTMKHKHKVKTETIHGYSHGVNPYRAERRAHGGICVVATCSCGAVRKTLSNAGFKERGEWTRD